MLLLPIGLDESRLGRLPWVSLAVAGICALLWAGELFSRAEEEADERYRDAVGYYGAHPYLHMPAEMERFMGVRAEELERRATAAERQAPSEFFRQTEQRELESKVSAFIESYESAFSRRFALVPARGPWQPGWLTYMFLHGGLFHLLGNMLVFLLVVGPFLEDVWGRPFFLAFYLAGGLVAALAQVLPAGDSQIGLVGASGAISACLGAFALRFAHRRVRIFYWAFLFLRGTFFVPAWLWALGGAALDLWSLKLGGLESEVAYAAHVGGFAFGLVVAGAVRVLGLEGRFAPEGAPRWAGSIQVARAAEALADGRVEYARSQLRQALMARPDDEEALLHLARLEASRLEVHPFHESLERLLARRLTAADPGPARELLAEFRHIIRPDLLRPATAYRAGEALEKVDPERAIALHAAAGLAAGAVGAKALLRSAVLLQASDPARARSLAAEAAGRYDAPAELRERAEQLARGQPAPPEPSAPGLDPISVPGEESGSRGAPAPAPLPAATETPVASRFGGLASPVGPTPVPALATPAFATPAPATAERGGAMRVVPCRLTAAGPGGWDIAIEGRRSARVPLAQVERVAVGLVQRDPAGSPRGAVLVDLLLRERPGQPRVVLRLPGTSIPLQSLRPGMPAADGFASLMEELLEGSGAQALPGPAAARGRPFARYVDAAAFERACHGRGLDERTGS